MNVTEDIPRRTLAQPTGALLPSPDDPLVRALEEYSAALQAGHARTGTSSRRVTQRSQLRLESVWRGWNLSRRPLRSCKRMPAARRP